ncbi:hypothetical protein M413DRAFT_75742, partial [Hebeloma cylindrosporum]
KAIGSALKQNAVNNCGDTGWGAVGLSLTVKYFPPKYDEHLHNSSGPRPTDIVWGALTPPLTSIEGTKYLPNVVHISGTIRDPQSAPIARERQVIAR